MATCCYPPTGPPRKKRKQETASQDFDRFISDIREFKRPTCIFAKPRTPGKAGIRPVAACHRVYSFRGTFKSPESGASDYLLCGLEQGKSLDGSIMQDWSSNPKAVDDLLNIRENQRYPVRDILTLVYGTDYNLVIDRMSQFHEKMKQSEKKLQDLCHVDWPRWKKIDAQECPPLTNVELKADHVTIIVIDQGEPHSVPACAGDAFGVYVGALSKDAREKYDRMSHGYLKKKQKNALAKPQHFEGFNEFIGRSDSAQLIMATCLLTGARPMLFPSMKPIQMPQPFNGSRYKLFNGYTLPDQDKFDLEVTLSKIQVQHGDIARIFREAALMLSLGPRCACDPSLFSLYTLRKFFNIV
jgi:hypothetical protein